MNYMKTGNVYIIRIDCGEEIVKAVNDICQKENITLGSLSGLGAIDRAKLGLYSIEKQEYIVNEFEGEYEITSLIGNVTTKDGVPYLHMHMTIGDITGAVVGGHLSEARVSATCEIVIRTAEGTIEREFNSAIGLNTMVFPDSSS
ncbi:MAG TPA: DNA-binding protein [Clostridiaceae bacterium]|jgi:predicted DNA-binding protein with PD1-like motif|nr:DNA-binding protein [Clostridiaceae bacterium]